MWSILTARVRRASGNEEEPIEGSRDGGLQSDTAGKSSLSPFFKGGDQKAPFEKGGRAKRGGILESHGKEEDIR
jgi:hypothetical protein